MNVLFLCTGNSCRSILAEATFNHLAPVGWHAVSAGSKPAGYVHPRLLALLAREGIATEGHHSKSWNDLPVTPDVVVTVCASAAGETCPVYLGPVLRTHWGSSNRPWIPGRMITCGSHLCTSEQNQKNDPNPRSDPRTSHYAGRHHAA